MNELKYNQLGMLGYSGSFNDRLMHFLEDNVGNSDSINDAEFEWLGSLGFAASNLDDRRKQYYNAVSFKTVKDESSVVKAGDIYFSPRNLFLNGEKGVWYDPSDFSTLFQDSAGTTPVTAVGQPVGKILDKSGRGNHATQSTATSRPILGLENGRYYLTFDGVDDWLSTAAIDFTATDKMTVVVGVRKLSDAARGILYELSADINSNNGAITLEAPDAASAATYRIRSKGSAIATGSVAGFAAPITTVLTHKADIAGDSTSLRGNETQIVSSATDQGAGNFGNYPLYIGRRGGTTLPFNGRLYGLIVRGAQSSDLLISYSEKYINRQTGAF